MTNQQIVRGMESQYHLVNQPVVQDLAARIALYHPELREAGIRWAQSLAIEGQNCEPFIQSFGMHLVEALMHVGQVPSQGYKMDITGGPTPSAILVAACKDVGFDPELIPRGVSMRITHFEVTMQLGSEQETVWTINAAGRSAFVATQFTRAWFGDDVVAPSLWESLRLTEPHAIAGMHEVGGHDLPNLAFRHCTDEAAEFPKPNGDAKPTEPPSGCDQFRSE